MLKRLQFIFALFLTIALTSCEIINSQEDIPVYIEISSVELNTNKSIEGTSSHKIKDVWVYVEGSLVGVFELPADIPVLAIGNHDITILAGIMDNGNSETRAIYPFYKPYITDAEFISKKSLDIFPVFEYRDSIDFLINEDFETGIIFSDKSGTATIKHENDSLLAFENGRSVVIKLDNVNNSYEGITSEKHTLQKKSRDVYIELNYKCNNPFYIGLQVSPKSSNSFPNYQHKINSKSVWNKIYLNLTEIVSIYNSQYGKCEYQVLVKADKTTDADTAMIYLDNIKLID